MRVWIMVTIKQWKEICKNSPLHSNNIKYIVGMFTPDNFKIEWKIKLYKSCIGIESLLKKMYL